jgi:hypothetical protein
VRIRCILTLCARPEAHAGGGFDQHILPFCIFKQAIQKLLIPAAMDDQHLALLDPRGILRYRLVGMGVRPGWQQRADRKPIAGNIARNISKDGSRR